MPRDNVQALKWFERAARGGEPQAPDKIEQVVGVMEPAEIERARALAREWKPAEVSD